MASVAEDDQQKNTINHLQIYTIIGTILNRCKDEATNNRLAVPLENYEQRVLYYTALSKSELLELTESQPDFSKPSFDVSVIISIMQCMKEFYLNRHSPTYLDVYNAVKESTSKKIPEGIEFQRLLNTLGYEYRKTLQSSIIMEDPKITFERQEYLSKISSLRGTVNCVYYIDERIITKDMNFQKPWSNKADLLLGPSDVYACLVMASVHGVFNTMFCYPLTEEEIKKWIIDILLPNLKPNSLIIMDSNPLHGTKQIKKISRYHSKKDMLEWLSCHNIPCSDKMCKALLYKLIEKYSLKNENTTSLYYLDSILEAYNQKVLRLPLHTSYLTPTNLMWESIKMKVKAEFGMDNDISILELKDDIYNKITSIPASNWIKYEHEIIKCEKELLVLDVDIEEAIDNNYELDVN